MTDEEIGRVTAHLLREYPPGTDRARAMVDSEEIGEAVGLPPSKVEEILGFLARTYPGSVTLAD